MKKVYNSEWRTFLFLFFSLFSYQLVGQKFPDTIRLNDSLALSILNQSIICFDSLEYSNSIISADLAYNYFLKKKDIQALNFAEAAFQKGRLYKKLDKDSLSKIYLEEAISIWDSIYPKSVLKEAIALLDLGEILYGFRNYKEAISKIEKALDIQNEYLPKNHPDILVSLHLLGKWYGKAGKYENALIYFEEALNVCKIIYGESHINYARILTDLGNLYVTNDNYQLAIKTSERALTIFQIVLPTDSIKMAVNFRNIGLSYFGLRDNKKAVIYYQHQLDYLLRDSSNNAIAISYCFSNMGEAYLAIRDFEKASTSFENSGEILIQMGYEKDPVYGWACENLGQFYYLLGEYGKAIQYQQRAIDLLQKYLGNDNPDIGGMYLRMARAQACNGELDASLKSFDNDIHILLKLQGPDCPNLYHSYYGKANALKSLYVKSGNQNYLSESISYFQLAKAIIDNQLKMQTFLAAQKKLIEDAIPIYENFIAAELQMFNISGSNKEHLEKAWQLSESLHGYLLWSTVVESKARRFAGIPQSETYKDSILQSTITNVEMERQILLENKKLSLLDSTILRYNVQLNELNEEQTNLRSRFEKEYPDYSRLKYDLSPSTITQTQQFLSKDQTLLEYFSGDSSIFVFIVQKEKINLVQLKLDFQLKDWIQSLRNDISSYYNSKNKSSELYASSLADYAEISHKLYLKLLAPISSYLGSELIVIPDYNLASLPFEVLLSSPPKELSNFKTYPFLINNYTISYSYSATMLHQMMERKNRQNSNQNLLAFAPFYLQDKSNLNSKTKNDFELRYDLSPLKYSGEEVMRVGKWFGSPSVVLLGKNATKKKFQDLASQYKILHLATHGYANQVSGEFSFLAFAGIEKDLDNRLLTVAELYNFSLRADLVVLSACETAIGEQQRGEGIISMARAFAYAGAKSIIASLWKVNDKSTMEIMDNFYKELKAGNSKSKALTISKRTYLMNNPGQGSHPFFWAGFIPVGDMSRIKFEKN
ncbi:MAG: CHAT domain-containing tetratricopeptide repeat protein [Saprospiraceae bacterium]